MRAGVSAVWASGITKLEQASIRVLCRPCNFYNRTGKEIFATTREEGAYPMGTGPGSIIWTPNNNKMNIDLRYKFTSCMIVRGFYMETSVKILAMVWMQYLTLLGVICTCFFAYYVELSKMSASAAWSAHASSYATSVALAIDEIANTSATMLEVEAAIGSNPTVFLDVAAGPGTVSLPVLQRLSHAKIPAQVLVTDFAPGMVEAAKKKIEDTRPTWSLEGGTEGLQISFEVMDAQALTLADRSVTHAACMFGIMFFPHRDAALRELRRVLVDGGRAVIGTWRHVGGLKMAEDFGRSVGALGATEQSPSRAIVEVGSDPAVLTAELTAAGFTVVEIRPIPCTFSVHPDEMLGALRTNPGMSGCVRNAPADTDWTKAWTAFLAPGGAGHEWVSPENGNVVLNSVANIALVRA
jgi:SAM-dependent methyltransferase